MLCAAILQVCVQRRSLIRLHILKQLLNFFFATQYVKICHVNSKLIFLVEVGLTTREACGNTVRNVMCSHFAGVCAKEEFDPTPYSKAIAQFFLRNPVCQNLP